MSKTKGESGGGGPLSNGGPWMQRMVALRKKCKPPKVTCRFGGRLSGV